MSDDAVKDAETRAGLADRYGQTPEQVNEAAEKVVALVNTAVDANDTALATQSARGERISAEEEEAVDQTIVDQVAALINDDELLAYQKNGGIIAFGLALASRDQLLGAALAGAAAVLGTVDSEEEE